MHERLQKLIPSALALTLLMLLVAPVASLAQSSLHTTITMYPESAGPGSTVEISGTGFPTERVVEVQLMTPDGSVPLATITTSPAGTFRQIAALPINATDGAWELSATTADGFIARHAFRTPTAATEVVPAEPVAAPDVPVGNSSSDIAVMLIVAVVLGGVAFGAMFVYGQVKADSPPGMGKGDDLIWGGESADGGPEQTATGEPHWKTVNNET